MSEPSGAPKGVSQNTSKSELSRKEEHRKQDSIDQSLTTILDVKGRSDLTILLAHVTAAMRETIESNFDAEGTLSQGLLRGHKMLSEDEKIMNPNIDTSNIDVDQYEGERKLRDERRKELDAPKMKELKNAALNGFDEWRQGVIARVGEVVNSKEKANEHVKEAAGAKDGANPKRTQHKPEDKTITTNTSSKEPSKALPKLYPPIPTPLAKLEEEKRVLLIHSLLLLLLSLEHYPAPSRILLLYVVSSLRLPLSALTGQESQTATSLLEAAKQLSGESEAQKKAEENKQARKWKVGLASVAGAAVIGITGGLAAPLVAAGVGSVMGGLGLGATAAAGYLGSLAGSTVLVGGLFGAYGGRMTGQMMDNYAREVEDFAFEPVRGGVQEEEEVEKEDGDAEADKATEVTGAATVAADKVPEKNAGKVTEATGDLAKEVTGPAKAPDAKSSQQESTATATESKSDAVSKSTSETAPTTERRKPPKLPPKVPKLPSKGSAKPKDTTSLSDKGAESSSSTTSSVATEKKIPKLTPKGTDTPSPSTASKAVPQSPGQDLEKNSTPAPSTATPNASKEDNPSSELQTADPTSHRLRLTICISGWLTSPKEVTSPWLSLSSPDPSSTASKPSTSQPPSSPAQPSAQPSHPSEIFALRWDLEALLALGHSLDSLVGSAAWGYAQRELIQRTIFAELMSAMWPIGLLKVSRVVDNPFSVAKARAEKAGEVLADALINRAQGERPVSLVGYSLGARVIYSCLASLARRGAFGLVEDVVLMGAPCPSATRDWRIMRSVVSGRLVNVYSANDYVLGFLYRTSSIQFGVAGLEKVKGLPGVENVDVSELVSGHLRYRWLVGRILLDIGWEGVDEAGVRLEEQRLAARDAEAEKKTIYEKAQDQGVTIPDSVAKRAKGWTAGGGKDGAVVDDKGGKDGLPDAGVDPEKEADALEKEVQAKTQKSYKQWAMEHIPKKYLVRMAGGPSEAGEAADVAENPTSAPGAVQGKVEGATGQSKTYTQWASEKLPGMPSMPSRLGGGGGGKKAGDGKGKVEGMLADGGKAGDVAKGGEEVGKASADGPGAGGVGVPKDAGGVQGKVGDVGGQVDGKAGEVKGQKGYLGWAAETLHIR